MKYVQDRVSIVVVVCEYGGGGVCVNSVLVMSVYEWRVFGVLLVRAVLVWTMCWCSVAAVYVCVERCGHECTVAVRALGA